jgi:hypothetical protein
MRNSLRAVVALGGFVILGLTGVAGCGSRGPERGQVASESDVTMAIVRHQVNERMCAVMVMTPYHIKFFGTSNELTVKGGGNQRLLALRAIAQLPLREMKDWSGTRGEKYAVEVFYERRIERGFVLDGKGNPLANWFAEYYPDYSRYMYFRASPGGGAGK